MDINEYMSQNLALLTRIAMGVEALVEAGPPTVNIFQAELGAELPAHGEGLEEKPAAPAKAAPVKPAAKTAPKAASVAAKPAVKTIAELEADAAEVEAEVEAPSEAPATKPVKAATKAKQATPDEARAALMAYAKREGNDAAMELLASLGGASVSALADVSTAEDDKLAELIEKCKG